MMLSPRDSEIQAVMDRTGMDYIQARNHLIQQQVLQERIQRHGTAYPLGKAASLEM